LALTRGQLIDSMVAITGDDSTGFRTRMEDSVNDQLYVLWNLHDWEFKHKSGSFNTVAGTESYDLSVSSTDIRSANDLEILFDSTNGREIDKIDLKDIRGTYPKIDQTSKPRSYAVWGTKTVYFDVKPDGIYTMRYLYTSKPTLPTADANDLETVCGLPDYLHFLLRKMLLTEAFLVYDDSRRDNLMLEIERKWLPLARQVDLEHISETARFKCW